MCLNNSCTCFSLHKQICVLDVTIGQGGVSMFSLAYNKCQTLCVVEIIGLLGIYLDYGFCHINVPCLYHGRIIDQIRNYSK